MTMTTSVVRNFVYIVVFSLGVLSLGSLVASAQVDSDLSEIATTSPAKNETESTTTKAVEAPWYKLEKLSGVVNQGDFVVGPGRAEIEVKPGQTVTYEISVANRISDGRRFELAVEDITGSADGRNSVIMLGDERGPYSIRDYISFPKNNFVLNLGERARIPITISIPKDAEPGGYYGSVLISTVRVDDKESVEGTTRSPIIARIGTLFFITVPGAVEKGGALKDFSVVGDKIWYEKGPIDLSVLFENTGSIHLNPYGEIRIKNFFNEEVGFVELDPWFSLPKSLRSREVSFDRELLVGRYTATAYINRGYDDVIDEMSTTFWVLPWKIMGGIFFTLFIILFGIRFFLRTFEFKRKR